MKKIIFTVTTDLNYDQRMQRICDSMAKNGYDVLLIGRKLPQSLSLLPSSFSQKRLKCFFHTGKMFYLEYNLRLFTYLIRQNTDAVCAIDLDTLLPAYLVTRIKRIPLVYDAHEYFSELPELSQRPLVKKIWTSLERFLVPRLKYAYTVGFALAAELQSLYQVPFSVVRSLPRISPSTTDDIITQTALSLKAQYPQKTILLYQGALNEGRGIEIAIKSLHQLPDTHLWLAGDGPLKKQFIAIVESEGLKDRIHFWGYLRPESLRSLSPHADIGLNLLADLSLNYYFSLANKTFDYIRAGLPAIHMDYPEYRQLNEENPTALLLPELSVSALVKAVLTLREEKDLYDQLKANCKVISEVYCWENEEKQLIEFWSNVLPRN